MEANLDNTDTISINTLALEDLIQDERNQEITQLNTLSKKVDNLHISLLYYRNPRSKMGSVCFQSWQMLVKKIGGSENLWQDIGLILGINHDDLNYISNSIKEDQADMVLRVFIQNETATLDKIVDAFVNLKRYDILKSLEAPFSELAQCFHKEDSGYHSDNISNVKEIITFANNNLQRLPPALNGNISNNVFKHRFTKSNKPSDPKQNTGSVLFLTFADDGLQTVSNIQQYLSNWIDMPTVEIITLSDNEEMNNNPENYIRECFTQCDYVVPILTQGYLDEINYTGDTTLCEGNSLDCKYVRFIYNLIVSHYIHATGCLNKKVRSVLPKDIDMHILSKIDLYPDIMPWIYENDFDKYFKEFLKK